MTLVVRLLQLYLLVLLARMIIDLVLAFSRTFRPQGFVAVLFEFVYTLTDPPLKALRRFIPPLRVGSVAVDLSFLVLFFGIQVLIAALD